ncbi:uncharacterized protein [Clytia hemisphaerica]
MFKFIYRNRKHRRMMLSIRLLFIFSIAKCITSVVIGVEFQNVLDDIVKKFNEDPTNPRYQQPFCLTSSEYSKPIHIFIWSPQEQHCGFELRCFQHNSNFQPYQLTTNVVKQNWLNPRLLFCVRNNILLVQQIYQCNGDKKCKLFAASKECFALLDEKISKTFQMSLYNRSGYSYALIELLFEMISKGNNFQQVSQILANLRMRHYHSFQEEEALSSVLTSFPSAAKLEVLLLEFFYKWKDAFEFPVNEVKGSVLISADHTFRVSKKIGAFRTLDGKFVKSDMKLFIVMDESSAIISWKLTDSTGHGELESVLDHLSQKCGDLEYICTDNCCHDSSLYQKYFPTKKVKLDLFHAVKRVTQHVPNRKKCLKARHFVNDFGLIFRQNNDIGSIRTKATPEPSIIIRNLETFLTLHKPFLSELPSKNLEEINKEIENLKKHILNGCLSGIGPGHGTENNENLHRLLNRSLLRGVSFVSHELLLAILTILFFYHNQNIRGKKHTCNSRIIPIFSPSWDEKREIPNIPDPYTADQQTTIDSKTKEMVVEVLIGVRKTRDIVSTIKEMCLHRAFVEQDVLRKPSPRDCLDDDEVAHKTILEYNLNAFGLVVFETARDGDCCFRSILHQLHNVFQLDDNKELENYLTGLSLGQSIEDDISTLRLLFVENLKNDVNYRNFLVNTEYDDVDDYKNRGVFSSNTGDFVVKVLSDVLRIPIMIIQSNDRLSVETFIPSVLLYQKPLVIALNIWEQHYSSTEPLQDKKDPRDEESEEKEDEQKNEDEPAICHCMNGCFRKDGVKSCPCIKANRNCSAKCRCRKCSNNKAVKQRLKGCRCQTSCRDTDGRNTKCPCFKNRLGCDMCNCKSCENPYGKNENRKKNSGKVGGKRKRQPYTAYKKKRSEIFLASKSMKLPEGCWSLDETACIYTCTEMVLAELNQICMKSIFKIYDYIYRNRASYPEVKLREKNVKQIKAKLQYMGFNI